MGIWGDKLDRLTDEKKKGLYEAIYDGNELRLIYENGELIRYGKVAVMDVIYEDKAPDGKRYRAVEDRNIVKKGVNPEEALRRILEKNDRSGVVPSPARPSHGLSERIKLNGENIRLATVRGLKEELFDGILATMEPGAYPDLDQVLLDNLVFESAKRVVRDANAFGNSFPGITSVYDSYPSTIVFTSDMHVPIPTIDGVPQTLFALEEGKYINLIHWEEIKE